MARKVTARLMSALLKVDETSDIYYGISGYDTESYSTAENGCFSRGAARVEIYLAD